MKVTLNDQVFIIKWKHLPATEGQRATECTVKSEGINVCGHALCSKKEQFTKDKGRKISLARAFKNMTFNKTERKVFWDAYLSR